MRILTGISCQSIVNISTISIEKKGKCSNCRKTFKNEHYYSKLHILYTFIGMCMCLNECLYSVNNLLDEEKAYLNMGRPQ